MAYVTPTWLRERVNDPCGTPNLHSFWDGVQFTDKGYWRMFERDSFWFALDRKHNAWYHFPTQAEMVTHTDKPGLDIWA